METAPKSLRPHLGFFGRRNVGKSSLLNMLVGQKVAIVSPTAGTTTDPVEKTLEFAPFGPVLFIDTAGVDDVGSLGRMRAERTREVLARVDVALLVATADGWGDFEEDLLREFTERHLPVLVVFNKADCSRPAESLLTSLAERKITTVTVSACTGEGDAELKGALLALMPESVLNQEHIVADILPPGGVVVLVIPVDKEAPKGRLILPQVMTLRNLLDNERISVTTTVGSLPEALASLREPPCLVVTDSQAFKAVAEIVPPEVPLTSFSVLFARCMGDLPTQAAGTAKVRELRPGDRVLIAEGCAHHPGSDDIGRVKIPRLLQKRVGGELQFTHVQGHEFPRDLSPFSLVILCGGCMNNRREILSRIVACRAQHVAVSNYGLVIAECLGILARALAPLEKTLS